VLRIRRRAAGLVGGALLLFLAGTNVQSGWLFVLSSLLLGAAAAGIVMPLSMVRGLTVARRAPAEAFAGQEVAVEIVVANERRRPKLSVTVRDPHVAPAQAFVPWIGPEEAVTAFTLRPGAKRGVVEGGMVEVASSAPFGVAEARRSVPAAGRTVVYPRVVPGASFPLLDPGWTPGGELASSVRRGEGQDFLGVREYQRGDSLRYVHWPSTARHGSLVVREFEQERRARLVVVVDTWADAGDGETALDLCCAVAATVTLAALGSDRVVALAAARDGEVAPPIEVDRTAALTWLAELQAPGGLSLPAAVDAVVPLLPGPVTCLLAFPTWPPNAGRSLLRASAELADRGVRVSAAIVDAASLGPAVPVLAAAEVEELSRDLASTGAIVYLVRPEEDLAACLARPLAPVG
jgi:uncharacterized protein (DUF58 family)